MKLWLARIDDFDNRAVGRCAALLSEEEARRAGRFHFEEDRRLFTVAHALVRAVVSERLGIHPRSLSFVTEPHGKPQLAPLHGAESLRFNLSHTRGLAALAIAEEGEIGVDVEDVARKAYDLDLAKRYFAPEEVTALTGVPSAEFTWAFLEFWTLKEAFIKAVGQGLSLPLDRFAFRISAAGTAEISFNGIDERPADWSFSQFDVERQFVGAVARKGGGEMRPPEMSFWRLD